MSILEQFLTEALKEHPLQRKVIQYPPPAERRGTLRNMLAADSMDGMRFRWFMLHQNCWKVNQSWDLDQWREFVDKQMLEKSRG